MIYVLVFSGLLIAIFGYLIVVVFFPGFDFPPEKLILRGHAAPPADSLPFREDVEFLVDGQRVRGWFYWSSGSSGPVAPCIIMATGLGGTRRMGLEHYALFYRARGLHCLTFDYRNSGDSEGQPRSLVWPRMQLEDLRGAMEWVAARPEIEGVFLWGASAAGSYPLILAAEQGQALASAARASSESGGEFGGKQAATDSSGPRKTRWPRIHGVICQVPALDLKAEFKGMIGRIGFGRFLRIFMHAQRDRGRGRLGLSPHYMPMVSSSGPALLQGPGVEEGYAALCAGEFSNRICARSLVMPPPPSALDSIHGIQCPVLIQLASADVLIASDGHVRIATALGSLCEVKSYEGGHFDLYSPPVAEEVLADQMAFINGCMEKGSGRFKAPQQFPPEPDD